MRKMLNRIEGLIFFVEKNDFDINEISRKKDIQIS